MKKFNLFGILAVALVLMLSSFTTAKFGPAFALYDSGLGDPDDLFAYTIIATSPCDDVPDEVCGFPVDEEENTEEGELTSFPEGVEVEIADWITTNGNPSFSYTILELRSN